MSFHERKKTALAALTNLPVGLGFHPEPLDPVHQLVFLTAAAVVYKVVDQDFLQLSHRQALCGFCTLQVIDAGPLYALSCLWLRHSK